MEAALFALRFNEMLDRPRSRRERPAGPFLLASRRDILAI
jgi:hypothetical protein